MASTGTRVFRNYRHGDGMARSRVSFSVWSAIRFLLCAFALTSLTACEFMQYFGGEGALAVAVDKPTPEPVKEDIMEIQQALADLGYQPGPVDGNAGRMTTRAIEAYQKQADLPVDGEITLALLENLRKNPVRAPEKPAAPPPPVAEKSLPDEAEPVKAEEDVVVIEIPPIPLPPVYETGDLFAWSDGSIDTVYRVSTDRIFWRSSKGMSFNKNPNFMMPPSSWDGTTGPGSATTDMDGKQLWSLQPEAEISFTVSAASSASGTVTEKWRCETHGEEKVVAPAGVFDTQVFSCTREGAEPTAWVTRTWYYAPAVRHYVRQVDRFANGSKRAISLVAMRPSGQNWPPAARIGFDWAIQDALDKQANGSAVDWGSTGVREKFRIMPTKNHSGQSGQNCRSFVLIRGDAASQRSYPAIACRDETQQRWLVPVLDKDAPPVYTLLGTS